MGELEVGVALFLSFPETSSQMYPQATGLFLNREKDSKHHTLELSSRPRGDTKAPSPGLPRVCGALRLLTAHREGGGRPAAVSEWLFSQVWRAAGHVSQTGLSCQAATS